MPQDTLAPLKIKEHGLLKAALQRALKVEIASTKKPGILGLLSTLFSNEKRTHNIIAFIGTELDSLDAEAEDGKAHLTALVAALFSPTIYTSLNEDFQAILKKQLIDNTRELINPPIDGFKNRLFLLVPPREEEFLPSRAELEAFPKPRPPKTQPVLTFKYELAVTCISELGNIDHKALTNLMIDRIKRAGNGKANENPLLTHDVILKLTNKDDQKTSPPKDHRPLGGIQ